jgi:hypothetical protein
MTTDTPKPKGPVVADGVIYDLVRCIARRDSLTGFGWRVFDAAIARNLIKWDEAEGRHVLVEKA